MTEYKPGKGNFNVFLLSRVALEKLQDSQNNGAFLQALAASPENPSLDLFNSAIRLALWPFQGYRFENMSVVEDWLYLDPSSLGELHKLLGVKEINSATYGSEAAWRVLNVARKTILNNRLSSDTEYHLELSSGEPSPRYKIPNFSLLWLPESLIERIAISEENSPLFRNLKAVGADVDSIKKSARLLLYLLHTSHEEHLNSAIYTYSLQDLPYSVIDVIQQEFLIEGELNEQTFSDSVLHSMLSVRNKQEKAFQFKMVDLLHLTSDQLQDLLFLLPDTSDYEKTRTTCKYLLSAAESHSNELASEFMSRFYIENVPTNIVDELNLRGFKGSNYPVGSVGHLFLSKFSRSVVA